MKKSYIYILIIILMITLVIINQKKDSKSFIVNGVKYSTSLDGNSIDSFPSKGDYEVEVNCTNAKGSWNYSKWVARISNITGKVSCNISFTSKTPTNINDYIKSLAGTEQGNGQIVHEEINYTASTNINYRLSQGQYGTTSQFEGYGTNSTNTAVTNAFSYSNNKWTSIPSNLTSYKFYSLNFTVPENGNYQLCYTLSADDGSNNSFSIYNGNYINLGINGQSEQFSFSKVISNCTDLGSLRTDDTLRAIQRVGETPIPTITFYLNKMNTATTHYDTGYRYEGKNPNNYIYFNNELWRIIGVFDSSSHGKTGEYLTKIIRNNSIGGLAFDGTSNNNWPTTTLYSLLNTNYYNATDGTNNGNCYLNGPKITGNCNYAATGLQSEYRNMVENATWYLGGKNGNYYNVDEFYVKERDASSIYSGNAASGTGYIGLMYVSDYGYSILSSSCDRTINMGDYRNIQSWLIKENGEWVITPSDDNAFMSYYINFGLGKRYSIDTESVRPVLYLKSNVQVYAGNGSISKPYQIKLAS